MSPQPSIPYQRQNPNQYDIYKNQVQSLLPNHRSNMEQNKNTIPILQRLFHAQQHQQLISLFIYFYPKKETIFSYLFIDMNNVKLILEINHHLHI